MSWYDGPLPPYLPICHRKREEPFALDYPIEVWNFQTLLKDHGEGLKLWVAEAAKKRRLAMHFFVPGNRVERLFLQQRSLWHKAWREAAQHLEFAFFPEPDVWWTVPLLEGRRLQSMAVELGKDMLHAGLSMIWLLLDIQAGGQEDIDFYSGFANQQNMRWVATNLQGCRNTAVFEEILAVLIRHHQVLNPDIGIVVNGVGAERRMRALLRVFEGRDVVFSSNGRIERQRRAM